MSIEAKSILISNVILILFFSNFFIFISESFFLTIFFTIVCFVVKSRRIQRKWCLGKGTTNVNDDDDVDDACLHVSRIVWVVW